MEAHLARPRRQFVRPVNPMAFALPALHAEVEFRLQILVPRGGRELEAGADQGVRVRALTTAADRPDRAGQALAVRGRLVLEPLRPLLLVLDDVRELTDLRGHLTQLALELVPRTRSAL